MNKEFFQQHHLKVSTNTCSHKTSWTSWTWLLRPSEDPVSCRQSLVPRCSGGELLFLGEEQRCRFKLYLMEAGGGLVGVKLSVMTRVSYTVKPLAFQCHTEERRSIFLRAATWWPRLFSNLLFSSLSTQVLITLTVTFKYGIKPASYTSSYKEEQRPVTAAVQTRRDHTNSIVDMLLHCSICLFAPVLKRLTLIFHQADKNGNQNRQRSLLRSDRTGRPVICILNQTFVRKRWMWCHSS